MVANAVTTMAFGAYAYVHGDCKQDEKFTCMSVDHRSLRELYQKEGKIKDLDLNTKHMGVSIAQNILFFKGDQNTNLLQVAQFYQQKLDQYNKDTKGQWKQIFSGLQCPISKFDAVNPASYLISNLGKIDYGTPIVYSMGGSSAYWKTEHPPYRLGYYLMNGGKYQCNMSTQRFECISEQKQKNVWEVQMKMHKLIGEVGAEKITMAMVMDMMREALK